MRWGSRILLVLGGAMVLSASAVAQTCQLAAPSSNDTHCASTAWVRINGPGMGSLVVTGADPAGVVDSAPAINAAAATLVNGMHPNLVLAPGTYRINSPVTLLGGQQLSCVSWGNTSIFMDHSFAPGGLGGIVFGGTGGQASPALHDCNLYQVEPNTPTATLTGATISGTSLAATVASGTPANGNILYDSNTPKPSGVAAGTVLSGVSVVGSSLTATVSVSQAIGPESMSTGPGRAQYAALGTCDGVTTGCIYPPMVYVNNGGRFLAYNLRFGGVWDGISVASGGSGFFLENIQQQAIDVGILVPQAADTGHIAHVHTWSFWGQNTPAFALAVDGTTCAAGSFGTTGGIAGMLINDWFVFSQRTCVANGNTNMVITGAQFDTGAALSVGTAFGLKVVAPIFNGVPAAGHCEFELTGGTATLVAPELNVASTGTLPAICVSNVVSAPNLNVIGGSVNGQVTSVPLISVTGSNSNLNINGTYLRTAASGSAAWTQPAVSIGAGSTTQISNIRADQPPSGGNVGFLSIATDSAINTVANNNWVGWSWSPPGNAGMYGYNSDAVDVARGTNVQWIQGNGAAEQNIVGDTSGNLHLAANGSGTVTSNTPIAVNNYIVANLPTLSSTVVALGQVRDANAACSQGVTPVGGGSTKCVVVWTGSGWIEAGY